MGCSPSAIRSDIGATIVLLLWCSRMAFLPLLWLGMPFATIYFAIARRDVLELESQALSLDTPGEFVGALLSPHSIEAIAFIVRIAVGLLALVAAYPLSRSTEPHDHQDVRTMTRHIRMWRDRLDLSRAFRSLRWMWIVRNAAVQRLGRRGARLAGTAERTEPSRRYRLNRRSTAQPGRATPTPIISPGRQ